MVRLVTLLVLLTFGLSEVLGQSSNAWIDHSKTYYKIQVAQNGIYKISYDNLRDAGFPVASADPRSIQLFHRGVEQAIHIEGESDGSFNPTDEIRFYGRRNDGTSDTPLYKNAADQPHQFYNIYTDTTAYFLTIGATGKRMEVQSAAAGGLTVASYHLEERLLVMSEQYAPGESYNNEIYDSEFSAGEGWSSVPIWAGQLRDITLSDITQRFDTGPSPTVEIMLVGRNSSRHDADVYIGSPLRHWKTISFTRFESVKLSDAISWSDITADGKLTVQVRSTNNGLNHSISVCYVKLTFPQVLNASLSSAKHFYTTPSAQTRGLVEITNVPAGAKLYDVTSPDEVSLLTPASVSPFRAAYNNGTTPRKLFLTSNDLSVGKIVQVKFRHITPGVQDYVIISHPRLRRPAGAYPDPVKAYAAYRSSAEGGGYDTLVVNIQQLYDQFNYGERSPLGIFNFVRHLSQTNPPRYLFLIGKGLENWMNSWRDPNANNAPYQDLVPPAGFPGSDLAYSMGLGNTTHEPLIPTGRLSVMYPKQVAAYLDKVKQKESTPVDDLWHKRILHLSGGIEEGEPEQFRSILENYAATAKGPYLGAEVKAIAKRSRDLEVVNIAEEVNKGLSLVTFFGHSSPTTLDFDVGNVTDPVLNYHNKGKYPVMLMNGCEVGAFFLRDTLFSENWVYARDKGASAFIAHNAFGLVTGLQLYSQFFYEVAFSDSSFIHRGVGDIQKETIRRYLGDNDPSIIGRSQSQQMMLLGDPAVKIFPVNKPDLEIKDSQISIVPYNDTKLTAQIDSFALKLPIRNYGLATRETFRVEVRRTLPDNAVISYDTLVQIPDHVDTLYFVIRRGLEKTGGSNSFQIILDPDEIVPELNENNNVSDYSLVIPSNATRNLYPSPFAIVNQQEVRLAFQTTNLYSGKREFDVEVDTTLNFSSAWKQSFSASGEVLASINIQLIDKDSTTYYWRTKLRHPQPDESAEWETTSFSFIDSPHTGWAQLQFDQMVDNETSGLVKNNELQRFEFESSMTPVEVVTYGGSAGQPRESVSVRIKGAEYNLYSMVGGAWGCRDNTINLIAFDKRSTSPYIGIFLKWYEIPWDHRYNCGREPFVINSFTHNEVSNGGNLDIIHYVNNIADGDSVLLFNIGNPRFDLWPSPAKEKLQEIGVSIEQFEGIIPGEPVVIFGKKGAAPGTARVFKSNEPDPVRAQLVVNTSVTGGFTSGVITTPLIGPAKNWDQLHWSTADVGSEDDYSVDVFGVDSDGQESMLLENIAATNDLNDIDAASYPFIRLKYRTSDETFLEPSQLKNWIVLFTPEPEGVLIPDDPVTQVTLEEGEIFSGNYRFVNITSSEFSEPLQVRSSLFNRTKSETNTVAFTIQAPAPLDTTRFTVEMPTHGLDGINDYSLIVNPRLLPEQNYENNVAQQSAYVIIHADRYGPVIDVTIDGKHIANGDYVSSSPLIQVLLWDENSFVFKSDTTDFHMYLTYPCEGGDCVSKRISMRRPDVNVKPGSGDQPFSVSFRPDNLPPGEYAFRAEGSDVAGNAAEPFELKFIVADTHSFQLINPYPNPFTKETYFGFSISSGAVPEKASFQILDLSGRTITTKSFDSGALTVGKNLFTWDGTDGKNNPLQTGIYLFRVSVFVDGREHQHNGKVTISR